MPRIPFDDNVVNIILLGSDIRPKGGAFRTDVMAILTLDPGKGTATVISIPRDLYVYIPGWRVDRINTADLRGGPAWVKETVLYNFGVEIDFWMRINFNGFQSAIDQLGGIYVQVGSYMSDMCGGITYNYSPGMVHMDGFTALCYVRMRAKSSDFDRLRRQQEVMQAIFNRVLSLDGLARMPALYDEYNEHVQTDLRLDDIIPLIPLAAKLASDQSRIHRYTINPNMTSFWRVPYSGASVLLPNRGAILEMLEAAYAE
jgi:LCP family protein required for cell wall assembly